MVRKKPRYRNSAHCGGWARNGFHFNAFFKTFFYQRVPRIRYTGSTRPGYKSALFSFQHLRDNALRLSRLIITVYGNNWFSDFEMVQQFQCAQIVFCDNKINLPKNFYRSEGYIFQIPYWRCDNV